MLAQTQHLFYQAIFDDKIGLDFIATKNAKDRLKIYRQNIFETLRKSLAITFPGIWILLGDDCANSVARAFVQSQDHLSTQPCLHHFGADFPQFLETLPELQTLPYLKDYAQFEWHKHLAYYAKGTNAIDPNILQTISENKVENLRLKFLPAVSLLTSHFALQQIQEIVNNPDAPAVELKNEKTTVIVTKLDQNVTKIFIKQDMGLFFYDLYKNQTLQQALENTQAHYPDFDLFAAMYILIKYKLIAEILS